jgi:hypothetical protein
MSVRNCFIRGSVVRYVHVSGAGHGASTARRRSRSWWSRGRRRAVLSEMPRPRLWAVPIGPPTHAPPLASHYLPPQLPPGSVDVEILHDATRREAKGG